MRVHFKRLYSSIHSPSPKRLHMTRSYVTRQISHQFGAGLIEVLVALLLLAIAVMGYSVLQINAFKLMDNANKNTHALLVYQNLTEQVRQTPNMQSIYQQQFARLLPTQQPVPPSMGCGLLANQSSGFCSAQQLAQVNAYLIWQQLYESGIAINMVSCPHQNTTNTNCVIMAWGNTKPTIGADSATDCLSLSSTNHAVFYPKAQCLMMAVQ